MGRRTALVVAENASLRSPLRSCFHFPSRRSNLRDSGLLSNSEIPVVRPLLSTRSRNLCREVPFPSC